MTPDGERIRIWGIVPAAGMSRRMGTTKQTLAFGDTTIVAAVVRTMLSADVDGVVVVTRTDLKNALMLPDDPRITVAFNDDANSHMIDSVRLGLARIAKTMDSTAEPRDGVLIIPGDMPAVGAEACRCCIDVYKRSPERIVIATHHGRRGHPMVFPFALRVELDGLIGGLNDLPRRQSGRVEEVAVDDPGILRDVDTKEDYAGLDS